MRQIKFRGKRIDTGEWITGDLQVGDDDHIPMIGVIEGGRTPIYHQVQESTTGQFTGLDDRNAIHIYEGDIVKFDCGLEATISYSQIEAAFMFDYRGGQSMPIGVMYVISDPVLFDAEVIGNIHDNPELIPNQPTAI